MVFFCKFSERESTQERDGWDGPKETEITKIL